MFFKKNNEGKTFWQHQNILFQHAENNTLNFSLSEHSCHFSGFARVKTKNVAEVKLNSSAWLTAVLLWLNSKMQRAFFMLFEIELIFIQMYIWNCLCRGIHFCLVLQLLKCITMGEIMNLGQWTKKEKLNFYFKVVIITWCGLVLRLN